MRLLVILILFSGCITSPDEDSVNKSIQNSPPPLDTGNDNDIVNSSSNQCPEGYAFIAGNSDYNTTDFCFMKIEARNDSDSPSATLYNEVPWHTIDGQTAMIKCRSLGYDDITGKGYDIMSNAEWMTIAVDLESNANNWTNQDPINGSLYVGHSYASGVSTANIAIISVEPDDLSQGNSGSAGSANDRRRTMELTTGEVVWDMSGNLDEVVDWYLGGEFSTGPTNCSGFWVDIVSFSCVNFDPSIDFFVPKNNQNIVGYSSETHGLGKIFYSSGNSGGAIRSSYYGLNSPDNRRSGLFTLNMYHPVHNNGGFETTGFRCVYRL